MLDKAKPQVQSVGLSALHPADWNPRTIKDERFQNLCVSIRADPEFLWRRPVLAQADGTIYAGNMRYRAAHHLGMETIPAIVEDVSDQLARERALRDNAQWGEWEADDLAAMLDRLRAEGSDLSVLGFDDRELQRLLDSLDRSLGLADPDDVPALPEEPVAKPGDLYQLGDHRLLCGDATSGHDVAIVTGGEKASCLWTDPPYGVEYEGGTKRKLTIKNDTADGLNQLLETAFVAIDSVLADGAAIYVAHPAGALSMTFGQRFLAQGWRLHQTLVWVKDSLVPGHSDYHYRHEPVLFGYKAAPGRRGRGSGGWYGGNDCSSVFEIPRPKASPDHPTSKPVALVEAMVKNSSRSGEIVLDPFLGSGSTLIAAERLGRRCFGIELDPRYVDVAVRRWEAFTGETARKLGD
ncbi:MAG: DNA modification methylase [Dehalococcoidia bacterium]|nr:DNA modification methylase [Dehalococcoidia bacterium]